MPGYLLHVGATVLCAHAGQAQPTAPSPRVKVSGQPIVTQTCMYTIAGCTQASIPAPFCTTANWVMAAMRVRSMGVPVLLQDSQAICVPTGTPLNVVMTQFRVKGM